MNFDDLARNLHVVGGDSANGSLRQALGLRRQEVLVCEDELSIGPAPATSDLRIWRSIRENFLRDIRVEWPSFSFDEFTDNGLLMNAERLGREDVIVWIGLGLPDQLLLALIVFLFDRLGIDTGRLRIIQFEHLRPRQRVLSMGELSPENIRQYCPEPHYPTFAELEELRQAWRVYTSSDPAALARYIAEANPMPLLHHAINQLIYRYPDLRSGISVWDERLLHYTLENGPTASRVVGWTMGHGYGDLLDWVGHDYLFHRLVALGSAGLKSPLVSLTGNRRMIRECEVRLTSFGERVLVGEANHTQENGIDDWVGGVHLSAETPVTFRDGGSLVLPR